MMRHQVSKPLLAMTSFSFSVVTPSFNMAPYLEETIVSVLANLAPGDEYFVIDGGSTDGSLDIIRKYESQLTGWVSEPDRGYADAIGKGFDRANGKILCWINAGDVYLRGAFAEVRASIGVNDMIFGDDFHIDENSRVLSYSRAKVSDLKSAMLFGGWTLLQDACFWRRDIYDKVGGINRELQYAADYDLFLRIAQVGRCTYVPLTFSAFRRHVGQKSVAGASAYKAEREEVRLRAQVRSYPRLVERFLLNLVWRVRMSLQARLGPKFWRRVDLGGAAVADLNCANYWPSPAASQVSK